MQTVPKMKDKKPSISLFIHAKLREANDVSGSVSALFLGGFSILNMDKVIVFIMIPVHGILREMTKV